MILILGGPDDGDSLAVYEELSLRGVGAAILDTDRYDGLGSLSLALGRTGQLDCETSNRSGQVLLEDISAVWLGCRGAGAARDALDELWNTLDAPMIPASPTTADRARQKVQQRKIARDLGFTTPDSDTRSVAHTVQVVVTVVGERTFAATNERTKRSATYLLPVEDAVRCVELSSALGLEYCTMDLAVSRAQDFTFIGLEPSGRYGWIQEAVGAPITHALVDLLIARAYRNQSGFFGPSSNNKTNLRVRRARN